MRHLLLLLVLVIAAVAIGLWQNAPQRIEIPTAPTGDGKKEGEDNTSPPDFTLPALGGGQVSLSELKGKKGVLVVFFTTWCPACVTKVPALRQLASEAAAQQIEVWGVNIGQDKDTIAAFVKKHGINYPVLLDQDQSVARAYNVTGIPFIVGIDKNGYVRFQGHSLPPANDIFSALSR